MRRCAPIILAAGVLLTGCGQPLARQQGYETAPQDPRRDTGSARSANAEAMSLIKSDHLDAAEEKLKAALASDVMFGPAHNNLGTVYYLQKKYYLAAWEFQYAANLMPHDPRPKNNLGLVFEAVGQMEKAADCYDEAIALEPDNPEFIGNSARLCARKGGQPEKLRRLLAELVAKDTRPEWVRWAREQLALMGGPPEAAPPSTQPSD